MKKTSKKWMQDIIIVCLVIFLASISKDPYFFLLSVLVVQQVIK